MRLGDADDVQLALFDIMRGGQLPLPPEREAAETVLHGAGLSRRLVPVGQRGTRSYVQVRNRVRLDRTLRRSFSRERRSRFFGTQLSWHIRFLS